jgi:ketosteroid isomerase-like protein
MNIEDIAYKFIEAINSHDVEALCELMTEDHTFIDSGGDVYKGVESMRQSWEGYFKMFPDYRIEAPQFVVSGDNVILLGKASGTCSVDGTMKAENHWEIPGAWKAIVADDKIKHWQIFADNTPIMEIMVKIQND